MDSFVESEQSEEFNRAGVQTQYQTRKIVLVGNPNVGKSALFSALTGIHADVSNFPGTTIEILRGKLGSYDIADTPGIYGVSSFNDEERIARSMILEADLILNVVSALSLDRDLFLTLQLCELGKPLVIVINQWDEAVIAGVEIDLDKLSRELAVPVLKTVAVDGLGVDLVIASLTKACLPKVDSNLSPEIEKLVSNGLTRDIALLSLEQDKLSLDTHGLSIPSDRQGIYRRRREQVNLLAEKVVFQKALPRRLSMAIGQILLDPLWGTIISAIICYLMFYQLLGVVVAGKVVDFTEKKTLNVYYTPFVRRTLAEYLPVKVEVAGQNLGFPQGISAPVSVGERRTLETLSKSVNAADIKYDFWSYGNLLSVVGNTLVGEYGILTLTVVYLFGLLLPLVFAFYLGLSVMEDSGYLPRLAVLVDRILTRLGLTGRAIIPLILGLGCATMATVTTRLLSTNREKIIAAALLGIAIPCSAQLGIVSGTLAKAGGVFSWIVYTLVCTGMLALTGLLLNKVLPGKSSSLMIDLPPMRWPRLANVLKKTWIKSYGFMLESIPMFCIAGLVVSVGQMTGLLDFLIRALNPIVVGWLDLPADPRIPTTFVLGIVRRDFAAFGLTDIDLTPVQAVVSMIVITLFVPCIATVGVMIKERGPKVAFSIWFASWLFAFLIGGLMARILPPFFRAVGSL